MAASKYSHWTEKSADDFLYKIAADFVRQIESAMKNAGVNQSDLAKRLKVSEGRVSQVLNNPGNLTLKKIVEYVRALGRKVAIVEYDDHDPDNINGPVNSEIFAKCWQIAGNPADYFALEGAASNNRTHIFSGAPQPFFTQAKFLKSVGNTENATPTMGRSAGNAKTVADIPMGVAANA
jgi:transcriptional regulator with XRE-family HTH domain